MNLGETSEIELAMPNKLLTCYQKLAQELEVEVDELILLAMKAQLDNAELNGGDLHAPYSPCIAKKLKDYHDYHLNKAQRNKQQEPKEE